MYTFLDVFDTDVDECAEGSHNCKEGSDCVNYEGYYECICSVGYTPSEDGVTCEPITTTGLPTTTQGKSKIRHIGKLFFFVLVNHRRNGLKTILSNTVLLPLNVLSWLQRH